MFKRIVSLLLALTLCLSAVPMAFATEETARPTEEAVAKTEPTAEETTEETIPPTTEEPNVMDAPEEIVPEDTTVEDAPQGGKESEVLLNEVNFPDTNFRSYLIQFDTDNSGGFTQAELERVTHIYVANKNISSLAGVAYFTKLSYLDCDSNKLTSLDVSGCPALVTLRCAYNQLENLDISKNTALKDLACYYNQLMDLNVSANPALSYLICGGNQLKSLNVSMNPELILLSCGENFLTELDVSSNTALGYLGCEDNQLTVLDTSHNPELSSLFCERNQLTSLDLSANPKMEAMSVRDNSYGINTNDNTFHLSTLPGNFQISKASNWVGGTVEGNILTVDPGETQVTYMYFSNSNYSETFTLRIDHSHSWMDATCTAPKTCSICSATEGTALGHDPEIRNDKEATKTEPGYTGDKVCKRCQMILERGKEIPAIGEDTPAEITPMYRLYNQYTNEHFFLTAHNEWVGLIDGGWIDEGIGWNAAISGEPVYRMYNPFDDFHFYSKGWDEVQWLLSLGWKLDGPVTCDAGEGGIPIYRLFNPYESKNYHHYTTDKAEVDFLVGLGWCLEGIAWYAAK